MTDNLLHALEEKIVVLLSELENLRKEVGRVKNENVILKNSQIEYTRKLQGLISLLDALDDSPASPQLISEEYATA